MDYGAALLGAGVLIALFDVFAYYRYRYAQSVFEDSQKKSLGEKLEEIEEAPSEAGEEVAVVFEGERGEESAGAVGEEVREARKASDVAAELQPTLLDYDASKQAAEAAEDNAFSYAPLEREAASEFEESIAREKTFTELLETVTLLRQEVRELKEKLAEKEEAAGSAGAAWSAAGVAGEETDEFESLGFIREEDKPGEEEEEEGEESEEAVEEGLGVVGEAAPETRRKSVVKRVARKRVVRTRAKKRR